MKHVQIVCCLIEVMVFTLGCSMTGPEETPILSYDLVFLDAENLGEWGIADSYENDVVPMLERYVESPAELVEAGTDSYTVTSQGMTYTIYSSSEDLQAYDDWTNATFALFDIVNRQLEGTGVRFYAVAGGNDLSGLFLSDEEYNELTESLPYKSEWPYIPTLEPPWYGQHPPVEGEPSRSLYPEPQDWEMEESVGLFDHLWGLLLFILYLQVLLVPSLFLGVFLGALLGSSIFYFRNRRLTVPVFAPLEDWEIPPDMRSFADKSKQHLSDMGFRLLGSFKLTNEPVLENALCAFLSTDNHHEAITCQFKNFGSNVSFTQFFTSLSPHGMVYSSNGMVPTARYLFKDAIANRFPRIKNIQSLFDYHQTACEAAANQSFQFVTRSPTEFISRYQNLLRDVYERQVRVGRMARNGDGSYRVTLKGAILIVPSNMKLFLLTTLIWLPKPNKEKLRKRVEAKLAKAKDLPPEERTYNERSI